LQQKLGTINDHATALLLLLLRQRLEAVEDSGAAGHLHTLLERESAELEQARHGFLEWWTPSRQEELRRGFEQALQGRRMPIFA
jgi:hypothetical protein